MTHTLHPTPVLQRTRTGGWHLFMSNRWRGDETPQCKWVGKCKSSRCHVHSSFVGFQFPQPITSCTLLPVFACWTSRPSMWGNRVQAWRANARCSVQHSRPLGYKLDSWFTNWSLVDIWVSPSNLKVLPCIQWSSEPITSLARYKVRVRQKNAMGCHTRPLRSPTGYNAFTSTGSRRS